MDPALAPGGRRRMRRPGRDRHRGHPQRLPTLAVSPLHRLTGWWRLLRLRRMLGLFALFYISLHLLTWAWLDQELRWGSIVADIAQRPYVTVGFAAWLLLALLLLARRRPGLLPTAGLASRSSRLTLTGCGSNPAARPGR